MTFTAQSIMQLLPAIHRIRDVELAEAQGTKRGPLEALLTLVAEQLAVMEEGLEQNYDDLFIETCNDWVIPYIGDLIAYESLHGNVPEIASPRAEVAHTIALRRRKGTAVVLEQLARDVTRWDSRVVEFFQTLATTQYMNHLRPTNHYAPNIRKIAQIEHIGSAFNETAHTVEVRRINSGRGQHNIPNIGVYLWPIHAYRHQASPAIAVDSRRFRISPLNHDRQVYGRPDSQAEERITHLAEPINVPKPLSRRFFHENLAQYYGLRQSAGGNIDNPHPSLLLVIDGVEIPRDQVRVCNLSDDGPNWAHIPPDGLYGIDPVLGRVGIPADVQAPTEVHVTYHHGFSADLGGGEYERQDSFQVTDTANILHVPGDHATIQGALNALGGSGVIEVTDNGRYEEVLSVNVAQDATLELRAANGKNPSLILSDEFTIQGENNSRFAINGFLVAGHRLTVPDTGTNQLQELVIGHMTLVPGWTLNPNGEPEQPSQHSLQGEISDLTIRITRSILGGVRVTADATVSMSETILDATQPHGVAYSAIDGENAGATLSLEGCTAIGKIHANIFKMISNSILLARLQSLDSWPAAVWAEQKQTGCVRFSFLPVDAIAPRRFRCQPDSTAGTLTVAPQFDSLRFGHATYGHLRRTTHDAIRRGADSESEMGAFHHLFAPQREANLRIRLGEYLRVGLEAGIFYSTEGPTT